MVTTQLGTTLLLLHQHSIILYHSSSALTHTHGPSKQEVVVWSAAILTFHCILHIQGEGVPHDLGADLAHAQLLWKPGGIETDPNQARFCIMTRSTGWPDGLAQPESLTNDLTDVQEGTVGGSHNLIIPPSPIISKPGWIGWNGDACRRGRGKKKTQEETTH